MKYFKFDHDLSAFDVTDKYDYVRLPYEDVGGKKVLFILDMVPSEDLKSGRLLSGCTGDLLQSLRNQAQKTFGRSKYSWCAVTFNAFRTFGKSQEFQEQAREFFADRIRAMILRYKPDYVVSFGAHVMDALISKKLVQDSKGRTRYSYWLGVPIETSAVSEGKKHRFTYVPNLSLNDVVTGSSTEASMLGYMVKCLSPIYGKVYAVDEERLNNHKSVVISTYDEYKSLMRKVRRAPVVAIDTEADNLNKIVNRLLTVQFAVDDGTGYLLPMHHKDTPFTPRELTKIAADLRNYFEGDNENDYHIYANAKFDLTLFRTALGVRYFANDVWDIFGGEFALDENLKGLDAFLGEYYYSLGNLSVQYGFTGYLNAEFGKQHRANFGEADLSDKAVVRYTTNDVVVPFAIHNVQKQRARDRRYTHYDGVVRWEISDTIHAFSKMEHTGAGLDVNYLYYLRTPDSPIEAEVQKMQRGIETTKAALKANEILSKRKGIPTTSLWGADYQGTTAFSLRNTESKHILFFEVLKLKPVEKGKGGKGKLDKKFQEAYAHVPEVAAYTALEKAKKLKNAYVKSFIKMLGENEDLQKTYRIRPNYGYLTVVTHRTSARDPNLQQIPSRSALGKHIKRLFIARFGTLYIKVDYRAHEVRGWSLVSFDQGVAELFIAAKKIYDAYKLNPNDDLAKRLKTEADIHIRNASYFFDVPIESVDKELRNAVKSVVFGLIYQMSIKSLAESIKKPVEFAEKIVSGFKKRFRKGMQWIDKCKEFAREHMYVEAPTHIRRHLWGYLLPESVEHSRRVYGEMDRRAVNSPIQGMCAKFMMNGIRQLDRMIFEEVLKDPEFQLFITNSVHDSLENEAGYDNFLHSLDLIERALTDKVAEIVKKRYGFDFTVGLEVDFEIGASLSQCDSWDYSVANLDNLVIDSLLFQRNKLRYQIDVDACYHRVFSKDAIAKSPKWMQQQIKNIGYKFEKVEKVYILEQKAKGEALLASAAELGKKLDRIKNDDERADVEKRMKKLESEGKDFVEYARELAQYRRSFRSEGGTAQIPDVRRLK